MPWWQHAVFYQVYVRSFADGNGDGVGDLPGLRGRLDHLSWLGVDAVWLTPFYPSPGADHGYDVADYRAVDPKLGTLEEFDALLRECHERGIRVVIDLVPNHTSDRHPWFQAALRSRHDPHRELYIFRDPRPDGSPPNNWGSVFGGPAWTFHEPTGQYYLHLFAPEQPDLNWRHPQVHAYFEETIRWWLDRGVDGFRIDVARGLYKDAQLRDNPMRDTPGPTLFLSQEHVYDEDQPEVHEVYRRWRRIVDAYPGERVLVGEIFHFDPARIAPFVRPDELHLAFNFPLVGAPWSALGFRKAIDGCLATGAPSQTWVLSNHDVPRHPSRYGGGPPGQRRARAAALVLLALPGAVFLYQGEELGLEDAPVPPERRQDPLFFRTRGAIPGRDGCRVPLPWERGRHCGFSTAEPWLPMPEGWCERSVAALREDPGSILHLYRNALAARRASPALRQGGFAWLEAPSGVLAFVREAGAERVACACNFTDRTLALGIGGQVLLASVPEASATLPPDSAVWLRL